MNTSKLDERWNRYWTNYSSPTTIGKLSMNLSIKGVKKVMQRIKLPRQTPILEIGCGSGRTISLIKSWGYSSVIGIDNSPFSIKLCQQHGLQENHEVILMDARNTSFADGTFQLVFAEGVLEHFLDFSHLVSEMCRVSGQYVLLTQPNHYSPLGRVSHFLQDKFRDNVKEYSYHWQEFQKVFEQQGFFLKFRKNTLLGDVWILLFSKISRSENKDG